MGESRLPLTLTLTLTVMGIVVAGCVQIEQFVGLRKHRQELMMIEKLQPEKGNVIAFKLSGKLHDEDYKGFVPEIEALIERHGKIRLLFLLQNFQGWDLHAAWDDIIFDIKHYRDLERIALVGDQAWKKWMVILSKPFTAAETRFFPGDEIDAAWDWLLDEELNAA